MLLDNHHGVDRRIALEASILRERGLDVRVVAWDRRAGRPRLAASRGPAGEDLRRVGSPSNPGGGARALGACARYSLRVWRQRRELAGDASLIVAHDVYVLPLAAALAAIGRVPLVYDAHDDYALEETSRYPPAVLRAIASVELALTRRAEFVVIPTPLRAATWARRRRPTIVLGNVGREREPLPPRPARWDLVSVGLLSPERRVDILLEIARTHPGLRIAIGGQGRLESEVRAAARQLPNLDYLGWVEDPDPVLAQGTAILYGQDPRHAYSTVASPNTVYQAIRVSRPLIYFCGGDVERLDREHAIGVRCAPSAAAVVAALERIREGRVAFDFAAAQAGVAAEAAAMTDAYARAMLGAARGARRDPRGNAPAVARARVV